MEVRPIGHLDSAIYCGSIVYRLIILYFILTFLRLPTKIKISVEYGTISTALLLIARFNSDSYAYHPRMKEIIETGSTLSYPSIVTGHSIRITAYFTHQHTKSFHGFYVVEEEQILHFFPHFRDIIDHKN